MKAETKLHRNPWATEGQKNVHVYGHLLESGDKLESGDMWASPDGKWKPVLPSLHGDKLTGDVPPHFVRPS